MTITNSESGTRIDEIARDIYRVSTPVPPFPGLPLGFTFNQFLIAAEAPLLFHTGPRRLFPLVREAVSKVLPPSSLRYIGFSHVEADESGSLAEWLALAPQAVPVCSQVAARVFANDACDRDVRALADGERIDLGAHQVTWFDTPHVPHGWECGFLGELSTRSLLCGDLLTQAGDRHPPLTESDILGPSEAMRSAMEYFSHSPDTRRHLERLAAFEPRVLACMHGSAFAGDGGATLRALARALEAPAARAA
jgi:glyoxylase-like metal-dependent hydrolase (beta-lactamase superfamily II)